MERPRISLDPLARALDRMLAHPLARLVEEVSPDALEAARELRANLPEVFTGLEQLAVRRAIGHGASLVDELGRELRASVARARRAGARPKRLGPTHANKRRASR